MQFDTITNRESNKDLGNNFYNNDNFKTKYFFSKL